MNQILRESRDLPETLDGVQHVVLEDTPWAVYETLLNQIGSRPIRITYDEGRMEIMSPLPWHERAKKIIARLIEALTEELNMPMCSFGSTTFRMPDKRKGLEPDECYYFKHSAKMRGRKRLNPKKDPPPELVVEIDITHRSVEREPIYAAMGVREVWRFDGRKLECLELRGGEYVVRKYSRVFPFLNVGELNRFVRMEASHDETAIVRAFRRWVRESGWTK